MSTTNVALEYAVFTAVRLCVFSAGGDGDGLVISPRWKELANLFEGFEMAGEKWFVERLDCPGRVTFSRGEESITFSNSREGLPDWYGAYIIVEVP